MGKIPKNIVEYKRDYSSSQISKRPKIHRPDHLYHKKCIEEWMRVSDRCPLCMKSIRVSEVEEIHRRIIRDMQEINRNSVSEMEEIYRTAIRRYAIFMCFILAVIIVMVLCSS